MFEAIQIALSRLELLVFFAPYGPYMPERIADSSTVVQAYALSEELNKWLLFDDTNIKFIGGWREVAASMKEGRHQPSLLFYERV